MAFDLGAAEKLRTAAAFADLALDPHTVAQIERAHHFGGDEDVVVRLCEVALRVAEETESLAADLDDALGEDGLARRFFLERHAGIRRSVATAAARAAVVAVAAIVAEATVVVIVAAAAEIAETPAPSSIALLSVATFRRG